MQSVYDPAMGAMDLPQIQVPRHEYTSNLAIAWTIQMSAIKKLKQHTLRSKMYVGTWDNKQGSTEVNISQRFDELDDALDKCRLLKEKCVWDLGKQQRNLCLIQSQQPCLISRDAGHRRKWPLQPSTSHLTCHSRSTTRPSTRSQSLWVAHPNRCVPR